MSHTIVQILGGLLILPLIVCLVQGVEVDDQNGSAEAKLVNSIAAYAMAALPAWLGAIFIFCKENPDPHERRHFRFIGLRNLGIGVVSFLLLAALLNDLIRNDQPPPPSSGVNRAQLAPIIVLASNGLIFSIYGFIGIATGRDPKKMGMRR